MKTTTASAVGEAARAMGDLLGRWAQISGELLESFAGAAGSVIAPRLNCRCQSGGCTCEIPPPCWAPQPLCPVETAACAGTEVSVRLEITNCGLTPRKIKIEAGTKTPGLTINPDNLDLGPMERGWAIASLAMRPDATHGEKREVWLMVRGCQDHLLRWTVRVGRRGDSCREVQVEDCPDLVHHWYDHFYCQRECVHSR